MTEIKEEVLGWMFTRLFSTLSGWVFGNSRGQLVWVSDEIVKLSRPLRTADDAIQVPLGADVLYVPIPPTCAFLDQHLGEPLLTDFYRLPLRKVQIETRDGPYTARLAFSQNVWWLQSVRKGV